MFRKFASLVMGAVIVAAPALAAPKLTPEQELAKALEGRTPGKPVRCITNSRIQSTQVIDGIGIIYKDGSTYYLNRPTSGAASLDSWDILVTDVRGGQLCTNEVVRLVDSSSRMLSGLVFLGEFVPYKKVKDGK